jgi:hypothetical protein
MAKNEYMSRLMAFDAEMIGSWGCPSIIPSFWIWFFQKDGYRPFVETDPWQIAAVFDRFPGRISGEKGCSDSDF